MLLRHNAMKVMFGIVNKYIIKALYHPSSKKPVYA